MATTNTYLDIEITNAGGNIPVHPTDLATLYIVNGTGITLNSNLTITSSDTLFPGLTFTILYNGNGLNLNGNTINIFGIVLTAAQAAGKLTIVANYNGTEIVPQITPSLDQAGIINGSLITSGTIDVSKLTDNANLEIITVPVSFESGEQGNNSIIIPYGFSLVAVYYCVTKTLADTDSGTIVIYSTYLSQSLLTITLGPSLPVNTDDFIVTTTPNTNALNETLLSITSKTTVGGKVLLSLIVKRLS